MGSDGKQREQQATSSESLTVYTALNLDLELQDRRFTSRMKQIKCTLVYQMISSISKL